MKKMLPIFLLVALFGAGCAKSYEARGYVYSQLDKHPIDSAVVAVYLGDSSQVYDIVYTDTSGYFEVMIGDLGCMSPDCPDFWMVVSAPGHVDQRLEQLDGDKIYLQFL